MSPAPERSIRSTSMPAARAPATSSSLSPTCSASAASQPASSSATPKIAGSGLRAPLPAEVTTPSSASAIPRRSRTSGSEQSQFETQTIRRPALAQAGQRPARSPG